MNSLKKKSEFIKLDIRDHVLLRPDLYIGNIKPEIHNEWIYDRNIKKIIKKDINYSIGFYKICDEVFSNSVDHFLKEKNVTFIDINIDKEKNTISIKNDGDCIPIEKYEKENIYIPTLIFGEFFTSSNYNDDIKRKWIGRHGYGAKLTNVFSKYFCVTIYCNKEKILFKQEWFNNMSIRKDPIITENVIFSKINYDYIEIYFEPDLKKFNLNKITDDIIDILYKRSLDICALNNKLKVIFNKKIISISSFLNYINLYNVNNNEIIYHKQLNWEIGIIIKKNINNCISFVNSNLIIEGTHINYIYNKIFKIIKNYLSKKIKDEFLKLSHIKNDIFLFLSCNIINPKFDSQSKTKLINNISDEIIFSNAFIKKIISSEIINNILDNIKIKDEKILNNLKGKKLIKLNNINKLDDANFAGTKNSKDCTLILTEGDSAKTLAVTGLSVIGRNYYGIYPLKGKLLNVRNVSIKKIVKNEEINNVIKILGLDIKKKYNDIKSLRYGKILLMTDQDLDGSHIKGLFINFIEYFWPELFKIKFIEQFITPILKVTFENNTIPFYNIVDYKLWRKENNNKKINVKYYKGLGTSTNKEGKEYFKNIIKHKISFIYKDKDELEIKKVFDKNLIDERKEWLKNFMERNKNESLSEDYIILYKKDKFINEISYKDFINNEMVYFSNYDIIRSIPNIIDGFKPSQRKILYIAFKLPYNKEIKVEQFAGEISSKTSYHHGEDSLKSTIIKLAHDFVGSNNINLLEPSGNFGSRLSGGKDAASPRYIYTGLTKDITIKMFINEDNNILKNLIEEEKIIEPEFFVPIIPNILINGSVGIGTGWSTKIPCFNPLEIINEILDILKKKKNESNFDYYPWYRNFKGDIIKKNSNEFIVSVPIYTNDENCEILITELPIGLWTNSFEEKVLFNNPDIIEYKKFSTLEEPCFIIYLNNEKYNEIKNKTNGFYKYFHLTNVIKMTNLMAFDHNHILQEYNNINSIINYFIKIRLLYYEKRKNFLINKKEKEIIILKNLSRFIKEKCNNIIIIENKKEEEIIKILINRKYDYNPRDEIKNFNYLLDIPLRYLTNEKIIELNKKKEKEENEYKILKLTPIINLWINDLNILKEEYLLFNKKKIFSSEIYKNYNIKNYKKINFINNEKLLPNKLILETENNIESD